MVDKVELVKKPSKITEEKKVPKILLKKKIDKTTN